MLLGTILIETLTKINANRRKWFCCLVLSYCDRRIWIAVDESVFCQSNLKIQHSNSSIVTEIRPCREASYECKDQIHHSFKQIHYFVIQIRQVLLGTILIETLTKINANRRNWFCCLVLSYCDRRIWIAVDENGWQSTKLNDNVSNWSTKDEIETSIRTFQSVRDKIEKTNIF